MRSFLGALLLSLSCLPAAALTGAELAARLEARFHQDRSGACVVAAFIDGASVARARSCALPRGDGGPGLDAAFEIGSVSKTMTAFLVADLIESGRWRLDDPLALHLPPGTDVPRQGERQILVSDVLAHRSGLPRLPPRFAPADPSNPYAGVTELELLAELAQVKLARPIGSAFEYSNFAMMLMSLAVARDYREHGQASDLEDALQRRLFAPLEMRGAYIARPPPGSKAAAGHLGTGEPTPAWTFIAAPDAAGVGGVHARLDDLVRYAQAELGLIDTPLAGRLALTRQPLNPGSAMSWTLLQRDGHALVMHGGATFGFNAAVVLEPARQRAVIVLSDTDLLGLDGLDPLALSWLGLAVPAQTPRVTTPLPSALADALVGDYALAGLQFRIWKQDGRLFARANQQPVLELRHDDHGDLYPTTLIGARLTPRLVGGRVDRFTWLQGGVTAEGVRRSVSPEISDPSPVPR